MHCVGATHSNKTSSAPPRVQSRVRGCPGKRSVPSTGAQEWWRDGRHSVVQACGRPDKDSRGCGVVFSALEKVDFLAEGAFSRGFMSSGNEEGLLGDMEGRGGHVQWRRGCTYRKTWRTLRGGPGLNV